MQIFDKAVQLYAELAVIAMKSFFSMRHTPLLEPQRLNDGFEESKDALKKHRGEVDGDFQFTEFQASKANDGRHMFKLGVFYYYGIRGVQRDHNKALNWFLQAAEREFPPAMELAGEIYARGYGVERNYTKSLEMFTDAVHRNQRSAYNGIGYLYAKGLGVDRKDPLKVICCEVIRSFVMYSGHAVLVDDLSMNCAELFSLTPLTRFGLCSAGKGVF